LPDLDFIVQGTKGALASLTFCGTVSRDNDGKAPWIEGDPVTIDTTMTAADFSRKKLGAAGARILAAFMSSTSENFAAQGALASLDISFNFINDKQAAALKQICAAKSIALQHKEEKEEDDEDEEEEEEEGDGAEEEEEHAYGFKL
jgi:hypothetical protein